MLASLGEVSKWIKREGYVEAAVNTFMKAADYYLVAHVLAHGYTAVTHEIAAESTKKIKIPNVCKGLKRKCITPFEMLQSEQARFVLERAP